MLIAAPGLPLLPGNSLGQAIYLYLIASSKREKEQQIHRNSSHFTEDFLFVPLSASIVS